MKQLTATPKVILLITVLVALGSWQAARIGAQSPQAATATSKVRSAAIVLTGSTASGGNLCASDTSNSSVVIDNSLTNGNPNAVIVATLDIGNSSNLRFPMPGPLYLFLRRFQ